MAKSKKAATTKGTKGRKAAPAETVADVRPFEPMVPDQPAVAAEPVDTTVAEPEGAVEPAELDAPAEPVATANDTPAEPATPTKRLSALDAASLVLADAGKPMTCQELVGLMAVRGLWSTPKGKTPAATLYSALIRDIATKGRDSRFTKTGRGYFASNLAAPHLREVP